MRAFDVPLKEQNWAQKWCVDVHNISSSKKLNGRGPLEIIEGHTQDIPKLRLHLWEPIWYSKKCKAPESPWKPSICMGLTHSNGYKI